MPDNSKVSEVPVAIIVPTYNRAALLKEALASLCAQTVQPRRILVVDDGSTDSTREVVAQFGGAVTYYRKENGGKAAALNFALSMLQEPLIWIFDDDDVASPEALEKMAAALDAHSECGFAFGKFDVLRRDEKSGIWRCEPANLPDVEPAGLFTALLERCFVFQGCMLVRRSCYDIVGPFDERLVRSQDYEMLLRLARRFAGVKVSDVIFHQRVHDGPRGSAGQEITPRTIDDAWRVYDQTIFRKLYYELRLHDYVTPDSLGRSPTSLCVEAHLKRFIVFARKGLWDIAARDFIAFMALRQPRGSRLSLREKQIIAQVFGPYSRSIRDLKTATAFHSALSTTVPRPLRKDIRRALLQPLPYKARSAARAVFANPSWSAAELADCFIVLRAIGSPASLSLVIFDKVCDWARRRGGRRSAIRQARRRSNSGPKPNCMH